MADTVQSRRPPQTTTPDQQITLSCSKGYDPGSRMGNPAAARRQCRVAWASWHWTRVSGHWMRVSRYGTRVFSHGTWVSRYWYVSIPVLNVGIPAWKWASRNGTYRCTSWDVGIPVWDIGTGRYLDMVSRYWTWTSRFIPWFNMVQHGT